MNTFECLNLLLKLNENMQKPCIKIYKSLVLKIYKSLVLKIHKNLVLKIYKSFLLKIHKLTKALY